MKTFSDLTTQERDVYYSKAEWLIDKNYVQENLFTLAEIIYNTEQAEKQLDEQEDNESTN